MGEKFSILTTTVRNDDNQFIIHIWIESAAERAKQAQTLPF